jgi:hypothetical protein
MRFYYMSQHPKKLHTTVQAARQDRGWGKQIKPITYAWWWRTIVLILIIWFENCTQYAINHVSAAALTTGCLPFWCVFCVRQVIKTAARDLVLHGIVSQSHRPSIINGVRFYDCCSNINCRLSRSKKASNINFTWMLTDFP